MGIGGKAIFAAVVIFAFCASAAHSQQVRDSSFTAPRGFTLAGTHNYLGLNLGRGLATNCAPTALFCDSHDRSAQVFAGRMFDRHWGAEVDYVDTGRFFGPTGAMRAQGLSLNLVGRASLLPGLGVYGKVGTAYGRSDTSVMGNSAAPDAGFGLSFGGGLSYDFSPRLSARFEWDSYDFRLAAGPVRSTSLGLQFRY